MTQISPGRTVAVPLLPSPLPLGARRHTALRSEALQAIREAIFVGQLRPGERINEQAIARQVGVSKTPVREALLELAREGLIVPRPYHGAVVVELTSELIREVLGARTALEKYATRLAMPKLTVQDYAALHATLEHLVTAATVGDGVAAAQHDMDFHELFYRRASDTLLELWTAIRPRVQLTQVQFRRSTARDAVRIRRRHEAILATLRTGHPEAVEAEVERHIQFALQELLEGGPAGA